MSEAGLAGRTDILNLDVIDGDPAGGADIHHKARIFFADMLCVKLSIYILKFKAML